MHSGPNLLISNAPHTHTSTGSAAARERRSHRRYPIELDLDYRLVDGGTTVLASSGRTCNISTGGMLIQVNEQLPADAVVEISVRWPYLLDGRCSLQLAVYGVVIGNHGRGTAVRIEHSEFRTRARHATLRTAGDGDLQAAVA